MSKIDWFHDARFGMFIHWGPYAIGGRGEWILNREHIPLEEYRVKYIDRWKAESYDPRQWARLAKRAGMRYMVLTARHHDGFCLWPTATTDWNAGQMGPRRDLLGPYVDAARAEGLRVGFYFSGADWHSPDYPSPYGRDWPTGWTDEAAHRRFIKTSLQQVEELLTLYGRIDVLWYDGCMPQPFADSSFNQRVYQLQPEILINERNGEPYDFRNCEQRIVAHDGPWEACMTLNDNWGYFDSDEGYKSPIDIIKLLVSCAKDGGNLLLNVGPKADGTIPAKSVSVLDELGRWLNRHNAWLYGSTRSPFSWCEANCFLSTKGDRIFVHLFKSPGDTLCIAEVRNRVLKARWLHTGMPVAFSQQGSRLFLTGIPKPLSEIAMVIELEIEGAAEPVTRRSGFWIPG